MGSLFFLLGATVMAVFMDFREVNACSCQPMHPQDLFCISDFVIKALVNTGRMVDLNQDGTFKRLTKGDKDEEEDIEASGSFEEPREVGPEVISMPLVEEVENIPPAPVMYHPRGPDSRMPGYQWPAGMRQKSRPVVHPPGYAGDARQKRALGRKSRIRRRHRRLHFPGVAPGRLSELPAMPRTRLMKQYRINIIRIFKGLENFTKSQLDFVYTPPSPLCDVQLPAGHSPFILMGDVQDGSLVIKRCHYKVDMMKLTGEQRSNVVRNMENRFPKECGRCRVNVCNGGTCDSLQPFTCTWKDWWKIGDPNSSQYACIHAKNGRCKWYNPLLDDEKPEDIDELRR